MIRAFGSNIAVKEIQKQDNVLLIGDSVGLERVVVLSMSDGLWKSICSANDYALKTGSEIYIKVDSSKPTPYVTVDNEKIFFISPEDIVAVDTDTVLFNETPDTYPKESK